MSPKISRERPILKKWAGPCHIFYPSSFLSHPQPRAGRVHRRPSDQRSRHQRRRRHLLRGVQGRRRRHRHRAKDGLRRVQVRPENFDPDKNFTAFELLLVQQISMEIGKELNTSINPEKPTPSSTCPSTLSPRPCSCLRWPNSAASVIFLN